MNATGHWVATAGVGHRFLKLDLTMSPGLYVEIDNIYEHLGGILPSASDLVNVVHLQSVNQDLTPRPTTSESISHSILLPHL